MKRRQLKALIQDRTVGKGKSHGLKNHEKHGWNNEQNVAEKQWINSKS